MTTSLRALQEFVSAALQREGPLDGPTREEAARLVRSGGGLTASERLEIYRAQFFARHIGCLEDDFPVLAAVLGASGFEPLACAYLAAHPPSSFSLFDLGAALPAFVAARAGLADRDVLADAARLDWAFVEARNAAARPPLAATRLAPLGEDVARTVFTTCPSLRLLETGSTVHELRRAVLADEEPHPLVRAPTYLQIHRPALEPTVAPLARPAFRALSLLQEGLPLSEALERVASSSERDGAVLEENIGPWFQSWVADGLFVDVALAADGVPERPLRK